MTLFKYVNVMQTLGALAADGWHVVELAHADGYPVFVLTDPVTFKGQGEALPAMLIAAGIHGEEPGAVVGLERWLRLHARSWVGKLRMYVCPCLNPWGFERGVRFAANGTDLNREFDRPDHPTVKAFRTWIAGRRFDLFMDLHEDCDFDTMYLYELLEPWGGAQTSTLGRRILDQSATRVPLSHGDDVGELKTDQGMVSGPLTRREASEFANRPIAIEVFVHHTRHVITVETPGLLQIETRAGLHSDALQLACAYLTSALE